MKIKSLSFILAIIMICSFIPSQTYAASSNYYSRQITTTDPEISSILSLINNQTFNTPNTTENVKNHMKHFIESTSEYNKVENNLSIRDKAEDNIHKNISVYPSQGCIHYAYFISQVVYEKDGSRKYMEEAIGKVTPAGLKDFLQKNAQAGEHLRFSYKHSLIFISADDTGFYTLQYYGEKEDPFLSFSTYEYFTDEINRLGKEFWIYNAETATNLPHEHVYDSSGYCTVCKLEYPTTINELSSGYVTRKDNVLIRTRPYATANVVNTLKKGATLFVVGQVRNSIGNLWLKLSDGNWVYSNDVKKTVSPACTNHTYDKNSGYCTKCKAADYQLIISTSNNGNFNAINGGIPVLPRPYRTESPLTVNGKQRFIAKDEKVQITGSTTNATGEIWYKLGNGQWVYSINLKKTNVPTPTPTISKQLIADGQYKITTKLDLRYYLAIDGSVAKSSLMLTDNYGYLWAGFKVTHLENNHYSIEVPYYNMAITTDGENVYFYPNSYTDTRVWKIQESSDGSYQIISKSNELFLDVDNANAANGTKVKLFEQNDAYDAQKWIFTKIE